MSDSTIHEEDEGQTQGQDAEEKFESTPEELTGFKGGPAWFDRKKVLITIALIFVAIVILGTIFSTGSGRERAADTPSGFAANVPRDFLRTELERSLREEEPDVEIFFDDLGRRVNERGTLIDEYGFPIVTAVPPAMRQVQLDRQQVPPAAYQAPPAQYQQAPQAPPAQQSNERQPQPHLSSLVPFVEGRIRNGSTAPQQPSVQAQASLGLPPGMPDYYAMMPDYAGIIASLSGIGGAEQNSQSPTSSSSPGGSVSGHFLQDNILWVGTVIPAVLVTAINTDLPGNVLARVTQNIYDSRTGNKLLVPQGTLLYAQYNNSVSYQQRRVQIVWDILIRPDGYMVELEGMNGVDSRGMAGLRARYRENWFEYVKAAGIIAVFSTANATLAEQVARYGSEDMAAAAVAGNAEFIRDIGGNFISRAMEIQPTLTVESGERINIMINKNIHLPPVEGFPVTQRYVRGQ